ncbi:hypothetical protein F5B19DRAFT_124487 [Rostrohypoxylon terebratum]|nr:hypothetical protein F5B19DRAFT_124487 [Rostrohypoxylon terebratum]
MHQQTPLRYQRFGNACTYGRLLFFLFLILFRSIPYTLSARSGVWERVMLHGGSSAGPGHTLFKSIILISRMV